LQAVGNHRGGLRLGVAGAVVAALVTTATVAVAAPTPKLNYYGGEVLANPKLVQVVWGTGTFLPEVTNSSAPNVASFLDAYIDSPSFAWMSEYSAGGRTIGPGSFGGRYTITPSDANDGATLDDIDDIQPELKAQIDAQHLPAPDANTFYVVFVPSEKLITMGGGTNLDFFCAYHRATARASGPPVRYAVIPHSVVDAPDCGVAGGFGNLTAAASHEIAEGVTDPDARFATAVDKPLAWYDPVVNPDQGFAFGEAGDICNHQQATVTLGDGRDYVVQKIWSNQARACVTSGQPRLVSLGGASVLEGDSGTRKLRIPVTLSAPSNAPVIVDYKTRSNTATGAPVIKAGVDFQSTGSTLGRLTFAPGIVAQWITVTVRGDTGVEPGEKFIVSVENVSAGYGIGRGTSTATILNDDARAYPTIGVGDSSVVVGAAGDRQLAFPVTVSRPLPKAVRVTFRVTGLTAVRGVHFKGVTVGVLTIPAGTTTVFQAVTVKPRPTSTSAKTLRIDLSNVQAPASARLVRTQGIGTLLPH
jgi:hypothetical protein